MDIRKSLLLTLILLLAISAGCFFIWQGLNLDRQDLESKILGEQTEPVLPSHDSTPSAAVNEKYMVIKVVDGDTFHVDIDGNSFSVRMIGIDTPETVDPRRAVGCFGKKASDETKRLIQGKEVILTKDITNTDKYDRLLRYVYLPIAGGNTLFVNDYLVRQGFAKNYTYPPDVKYNARFVEAEKEARENLRGLWNECK